MNLDRFIGIVGLIIGVAGVLLAIWIYKRGEKRRIPTFVTSLAPEILVKAILTKLDGFSLTHKEKPIGENGVTAFFAFFWNDGRLPILQSDITSPYTISFSKNVRILSLSIAKATRPILGAKAELISGEEADSVELGFAVLEPGDGIRIQIIIDGPTDTSLIFSGSCLDSKRVRVLPPDSAYFESRAKRFKESYMPIIFALAMGSALGGLGWLIALMGKHLPPPFNRVLGVALLVLFGVLVLFAIGAILREWYRKWSATSVPPEIRN